MGTYCLRNTVEPEQGGNKVKGIHSNTAYHANGRVTTINNLS
jgi:hypothetical protein